MLINPQTSAIDEILKSSGVMKAKGDKNNLKDILEDKGIGLESVIEQLSNQVLFSQDETIKARSIDTALKLHKVMENENSGQVQVNIVIQGSEEQKGSIASILIPREIPSQLEA